MWGALKCEIIVRGKETNQNSIHTYVVVDNNKAEARASRKEDAILDKSPSTKIFLFSAEL